MNDKEFLSYVHAHSRTERALFSGEQLTRLLNLSGTETTVASGWYALFAPDAEPLIRKAQERLNAARLTAAGVRTLQELTRFQRQALVEKAFGREILPAFEVGAVLGCLQRLLGVNVPAGEVPDFWRWFSRERGAEWLEWGAVGPAGEDEVVQGFEKYLEICLEKPLAEALAELEKPRRMKFGDALTPATPITPEDPPQ